MILSYARVSTAEQAQDGATSIGEQHRKIQALAGLRGLHQYDVVKYTDEGVSGSISLGERTYGGKMLLDARPGDIVAAAKLDRLFRSASDALVTVERLQQNGIDVVLLDMGTDPVTQNGPAKLFFTMLSAFAEFERTRIAERMEDGREGKRRRGGSTGGAAKYGWKIIGRGREAKLEPNPAEQEVIELVLDLARQNKVSEVTRHLNETGVKSRTGQPWQITQICRIVDHNRLGA